LFLSYTRPPFCYQLWILLIALLNINLPSAYQQLQAPSPHPSELKTPAGSSARRGCSRLRQIHAPLLRTRRDRDDQILTLSSP